MWFQVLLSSRLGVCTLAGHSGESEPHGAMEKELSLVSAS